MTHSTPSRWFIVTMAALLALTIFAESARAQNNTSDSASGRLNAEFQKLAQNISGYLKGDESTSNIAIGAFTGQPQIATSSGRKMQKLLSDELKKHGIEDSRQSRLACKGEYIFLNAKERAENEGSMVMIRVTISEGLREKNRYECRIADVDDVADLFAPPNLKLDPGATDKQREEQFSSAIDKFLPGSEKPSGEQLPPSIVNEVELSSGKGSNYAVEIHVRKDGEEYVAKPLTNDAGLTFVDLNPKDIYGVKIHNRSPHYAAVAVTIDGLNMFEFCEIPHYRQLGKLVIPPGKSYLVKGWYVRNDQTDTFLVDDTAKSSPEELRGLHSPEIGTISVKFAVAVPEGTPFPDDETRLRALKTTRGPSISGVNFLDGQMRIGVMREILSIRYNRPLPP